MANVTHITSLLKTFGWVGLVCDGYFSALPYTNWACRTVLWSNWTSTQNRTSMSIREECGRKLLWNKPCREKRAPSVPVSHPRHPCAPIHGISLMRVEMSAMIHSERKRETGRRTKGFYAACLVFSPRLYSGRFVAWLVDPLTHFHMSIRLGIIFSKEQSAYVVWSGVIAIFSLNVLLYALLDIHHANRDARCSSRDDIVHVELTVQGLLLEMEWMSERW